jgi:hypothetical protein
MIDHVAGAKHSITLSSARPTDEAVIGENPHGSLLPCPDHKPIADCDVRTSRRFLGYFHLPTEQRAISRSLPRPSNSHPQAAPSPSQLC